MSAKLFFPPGINYIPQPDFDTNPTENAGWEGSQSYLAKKSGLTRGGALDSLFRSGVPITSLDPNIPIAYSFLRLKLFNISDHAPGVVKIDCTFTGYAQEGTNGSSGEEITFPTFRLRGDLEEASLTYHKKWIELGDESKKHLGLLITGEVLYFIDDNSWGSTGGDGDLNSETVSAWPPPEGDELQFARMIAQGRVTYKKPTWTYSVRTEGSIGFTAAQLNKLGKIVSNPPGNPVTPSARWTWMMVGPDQEQSGEKRFFKDLQFQLIEKNDENEFLYD